MMKAKAGMVNCGQAFWHACGELITSRMSGDNRMAKMSEKCVYPVISRAPLAAKAEISRQYQYHQTRILITTFYIGWRQSFVVFMRMHRMCRRVR